MIPAFRRIIVFGRALTRREQGPLIYSGFDMKHPGVSASVVTTNYALAFRYWVPVAQRCCWAGRSPVADTTAQEAGMLATGELEEVRRNFEFPATMLLRDVGAHLLSRVWEPECVRRLGEIPEVFRGANSLALAPAAQQLEQGRNRIELARS